MNLVALILWITIFSPNNLALLGTVNVDLTLIKIRYENALNFTVHVETAAVSNSSRWVVPNLSTEIGGSLSTASCWSITTAKPGS